MSNPILLIHGLWMTPRSWEKFAERYTTAGHEVHAPAWPGLEGDVEALRADSTPLASLSITKIVDHYERFIRGLDTTPIIMGHSFGGLFMQLLVDRGLGAAGVGLSAAQPRGIDRAAVEHAALGRPHPAQPTQPSEGSGVHARGLPLHDDEHAVGRGIQAVLRAVRRPRRRPGPLRGRSGRAQPPDGVARSTSGGRPSSDAVRRVRTRSRRTGQRDPGDRQEVPGSRKPSPSTSSSPTGRTSPGYLAGSSSPIAALDWAVAHATSRLPAR